MRACWKGFWNLFKKKNISKFFQGDYGTSNAKMIFRKVPKKVLSTFHTFSIFFLKYVLLPFQKKKSRSLKSDYKRRSNEVFRESEDAFSMSKLFKNNSLHAAGSFLPLKVQNTLKLVIGRYKAKVPSKTVKLDGKIYLHKVSDPKKAQVLKRPTLEEICLAVY